VNIKLMRVVLDLAVTCFLTGGPMLGVIMQAAGISNIEDLKRSFSSRQMKSIIEKAIANCKVKVLHTGHNRKCKGLGPVANDNSSKFIWTEGGNREWKVADYFEEMAKRDARYRNALPPGGRLRYPFLPTINVGTLLKPMLVPCELVAVLGGQVRSNVVNAEMTAKLVKLAATPPNERHAQIVSSSVLSKIRDDTVSRAFGVSGVELSPIVSYGRILPPVRIEYAQGKIAEPELRGAWKMDDKRVLKIADGGSQVFGILIVTNDESSRPSANYDRVVSEFFEYLLKDFSSMGVSLRQGGPLRLASHNADSIGENLHVMRSARIVFVLMHTPCYEMVKYQAERHGILTQCLKWKNIERRPSGYASNVALKVNVKIGGTNHRIAGERTAVPTPALTWAFEKPCMLVGIDVSHPEPGSQHESVAGVVASMDSSATEYAAQIMAQASREEMVTELQDAMVKLFTAFKNKNKRLPEHVIIFRDGVSDGQFNIVLERELPAIKNAIALSGVGDVDSIKIAIVICQKRHRTRLVYQTGDKTFVNLCPGVVIDSVSRDSIASAVHNEFYLNSHVAIQGTNKACKYSLIHDEIGFTIPNLQMLAYRTCYLYSRCNRSVSYATPAYYAHHAATRGKTLIAGGAPREALKQISETFCVPGRSMFFI
jgi:eukaryotic translation initiation factor 2C